MCFLLTLGMLACGQVRSSYTGYVLHACINLTLQ